MYSVPVLQSHLLSNNASEFFIERKAFLVFFNLEYSYSLYRYLYEFVPCVSTVSRPYNDRNLSIKIIIIHWFFSLSLSLGKFRAWLQHCRRYGQPTHWRWLKYFHYQNYCRGSSCPRWKIAVCFALYIKILNPLCVFFCRKTEQGINTKRNTITIINVR